MSDLVKKLLKNKKALAAIVAATIVAVVVLACTGNLGTVLNLLVEEETETSISVVTDAPAGATDAPQSDATAKPTDSPTAEPTDAPTAEPVSKIAEDGVYSSKEDVAEYINTYGKLPSNYITKKEAEALGWPGGGLDDYAEGKMIGGDKFGNYEGLLPTKSGRVYYECDIDTLHANSRGAKRIVFSNDGLIYYSEDHYETFTLLYGQE